MLVSGWRHLAHGADAAEEALALVFGRRVLKDRQHDPLTPSGFESILRAMVRDLVATTSGPEQAAMKSALQTLDVDWPNLSAKDRSRFLAEAQKALGGLPDIVIPRAQHVIGAHGTRLIQDTKRATAAKYDLPIKPSFTTLDQRVVEHARESQALFIRDQYGKRSERFSAVARTIISSGLEKGLDRHDIAQDLAASLNTTSAARSEAYWTVVASIFSARARSYATLAEFAEAGIEQMLWSSTLDEVTSVVCRFMDGKIFSASAALERFAEVASSPDPENVKTLQPFLQVGRDDKGNQGIYYKGGDGNRVTVARVTDNAVGRVDDKGSFSHAMSPKQLEAAGISAPPAHGHCRSLLIPHFEFSQVPATAPVGAPAAAAAPVPKPPKRPSAATDNALVEMVPAKPGRPGEPIPPPPPPTPRTFEDLPETKLSSLKRRPLRGGASAYLKRNRERLDELPFNESNAIGKYTYGYDWAMRQLDRNVDPDDVVQMVREFRKGKVKAWPDASPEEHVDLAGKYLARAKAGLARAHADEPVQVYRGLANVGDYSVRRLLNDEVIQMEAITSTTRDPAIARGFMDRSLSDEGIDVMLHIRQRNGVCVEPISQVAHEEEVILAKGTKLRVLSRARASDRRKTIVIECEEVE